MRQLWQRFVALRSTTELARELTREGITTKAWTNAKGGRVGGVPAEWPG